MSPPVNASQAHSSQTPSSISSSLLQRIRAGEQDAWRRLVGLFGPVVYRWSREFGVQAADAADVVQEVFRTVAAHAERFHRDSKEDTFRGWLWTITRNKARDHFRTRRSQPSALGGTDAQEHLLQVPEGSSERLSGATYPLPGKNETAELARRALEMIRAEFEDRTWQAFARTTLDRRSPAEVGEELGMSVAAVYQAKSRVMRRIRRELGDLFG